MKRVAFLLLLVACDRSAKQPDPSPTPTATATATATATVPDPKQAAAAHDAKQWQRCADLWLAVANTTRGEAMAAPLYDAACCQAQAGDRDAAFKTLDRAVAAGLNEPQIQNDIDLLPLHADPRWPELVARIEDARARAESAVAEPSVRSLLLVLEADREASRTANDPQAEHRITQALKDIVAKYGWPGRSLVGRDGAHAAWFVVQHAQDVAFQRECLEKLELAVAQGEAQAVEHAYLYDRVAVNTGKPQRWGTQFDEATRRPFPIEDPERVDERRKAIGLSTMAEYERFLRETNARP